jgi:SIT family siderophore-iron:H+ symporter-like MFS transporter
MISFPTQAAIQSVTKHEHLASITACNLLVYYLSGGIGSAVGGGIWTNLVPDKMAAYFADKALAAEAYANPIGFIKKFAPGTPERIAIARAHDETQRIMVTVGACIAGVGFLVSLFLENVKLSDEATLAEVEALDEYGNQRIQPAAKETAAGERSWLQKAWRF